MGKMVDMKMSAKAAEEYAGLAPKPGDGPRYPYGLCLYLDNETMQKLGFEGLPAVGSTLTVTAAVVVTSIGMSLQQDGDKEARAELQITEMMIAGDKPSADETLYGKAK